MLKPAQHIIGNAILEIEADGIFGSGSSAAFRLQKEAVLWANDFLLPELERLLAILPEQSESVLIERLDLEINTGSGPDWSERALEKIKAELEPLIIQQIKDQINNGNSRAELSSSTDSNRMERVFFEKLVYFLKNGVLPWNWVVNSSTDLEFQFSLWLETGRASGFKYEFGEVLGNGNARIRLLKSFSSTLVQKAFSKLWDLPNSFWSEWKENIQSFHHAFGAMKSKDGTGNRDSLLRQEQKYSDAFPGAIYLESMLLGSVVENQNFMNADWDKRSIHSFVNKVHKMWRAELYALRADQFSSPLFSQAWGKITLAETLKPRLKAEDEDISSIQNHPAVNSFSIAGQVTSPSNSVLDPDKNPLFFKGERSKDRQASATEKAPRGKGDFNTDSYFIPYAGLILVAPFLSRLFERLGIAKENAILHPALALTVMHYVATGFESPEDYALALPKVLLGLELDLALDFPLKLSDEVKVEVDGMLGSAIEHWSVVGNTSVAGLRESFLSRRGKLSRNSKGEWLLQVEQKSYDMLIQQLPWSINLVRLPWMPHILSTQWVD